MKFNKITTASLAAILALGLSACRDSNKDGTSKNFQNVSTTKSGESETAVSESSTVGLQSYESSSSDKSEDTVGTSVKIVDHKISKDYADKDVLVVNYEFFNGEDSEESFSFLFTDKAFQNGIECDSTIIGCDDVDTQAQLNDVRPGYSYTVSVGYHLSDMSNVEIQVTDLFGTKTYLEETISLS